MRKHSDSKYDLDDLGGRRTKSIRFYDEISTSDDNTENEDLPNQTKSSVTQASEPEASRRLVSILHKGSEAPFDDIFKTGFHEDLSRRPTTPAFGEMGELTLADKYIQSTAVKRDPRRRDLDDDEDKETNFRKLLMISAHRAAQTSREDELTTLEKYLLALLCLAGIVVSTILLFKTASIMVNFGPFNWYNHIRLWIIMCVHVSCIIVEILLGLWLIVYPIMEAKLEKLRTVRLNYARILQERFHQLTVPLTMYGALSSDQRPHVD